MFPFPLFGETWIQNTLKRYALLRGLTKQLYENFCLERKTRLELATLTLARLCSTNWAISAYRFSDYKGNTIFLLCNTFGVKLRWKSRFFLEWSRLYSCNIPVISSLLFRDVWIYFPCTKSGGIIAHALPCSRKLFTTFVLYVHSSKTI